MRKLLITLCMLFSIIAVSAQSESVKFTPSLNGRSSMISMPGYFCCVLGGNLNVVNETDCYVTVVSIEVFIEDYSLGYVGGDAINSSTLPGETSDFNFEIYIRNKTLYDNISPYLYTFSKLPLNYRIGYGILDGSSSSVPVVYYDTRDNITGIKSVKYDTHKRIYDLTGKNINNPVKGNLYIINGKKVVY